ncbi:MAG: polysaccharide pyruvyl transferase family protein [Pseudomonadales bacterium]|nr:polysaccharide pyruvyl transferase family protein [Pseudomonadales bacterium]
MTQINVLLGGVPFGCNNIGDEAILARIVDIVRQISPLACITVCTRDQQNTAQLLGVKTCALYGFDQGPGYLEAFISVLKQTDVYIWSGATGLSDYPQVGLDCLSLAQQCRVKTVVFCTGMNDTLNPAHFKLQGGKKLALFAALNALCFNQIDFIKTYDIYKEAHLRRRLKPVLDACDLVVNRDEQSRDQVMRSKLERQPMVAADPAITLTLTKPTEAIWGTSMMDFLQRHPQRLGICISSQQALVQEKEFIYWLDQVVAQKQLGIVFIPMNAITDFELMANLRESMLYKDSTIIASGSERPEAIAGLAGQMNAIISSRLHLLIFASISATPCIGIGRGSKVNNFLSQFGQFTAGTTQDIAFDELDTALNEVLGRPIWYRETAQAVRNSMLERLNVGIDALANVLAGCEPLVPSQPHPNSQWRLL